ncbi:tRNA 2-selenouridine(34) synthase MnmH [Candidatus Puniceispirillum sp.]|nr:tRNA 2-selenouridine(34) synthase MnmH [Candidatus Puniceispirillum sp.]
MSAPITRMDPKLSLVKDATFDSIIDVRSPSEFLDDHMPNAINLPVLKDAQRALVGTIYKKINPFEAKRTGAALVAQNIAEHLQTKLVGKDRNWRPLIYCWRGGKRSCAMAKIFSDIGWHSTVIAGGYKAYRKTVLDGLDYLPWQFQLIVLSGPTGTAKTHILRAAAGMGAQVLDLERLANHRGSLLGGEPGSPQPAQRLFESRLNTCLQAFDITRPVFIESESNKIGQIHIPSALWASMRQARRISINAPFEARVAFLQRDYRHIIEKSDNLMQLLSSLRRRYSAEVFNKWYEAIIAENWNGFVEVILETHYDPSYARSMASRPLVDILSLQANRLDKNDIMRLAKELVALQN